jgi:SAM-dependent methyltransferase
MLVEHLIHGEVNRVLDLGSGDGHMIALLRERWPDAAAIGLDLSPALVDAAQRRFGGAEEVRVEAHDLMQPLPRTPGPIRLGGLGSGHPSSPRRAQERAVLRSPRAARAERGLL